MTFTPLKKEERAEWRGLLAGTDNARLAAAFLLLLLSSLTLALCESSAVAALYLVYAVVFYYTLTHSIRSILLLALPGVLLFTVSYGIGGTAFAFALPAAYAALLLGSVAGAFLILQLSRRPRLYPVLALVPAVAYLIALAVSRSPRLALLALLPAAVAAVLGFCILTCRPQTSSLLLIATVIGALAVGAYLVYLLFTGFPAGNVLVALVDRLRAGIVSYYNALVQASAAQGMYTGLSPNDIENAAALLGNLLPGLFIVACLLLAFAMWRMLLRMLVQWQTLPRVPVRLAALTVSPYAAGIFVVAFLVSAVANAETVTLVGMLAENLSFVLQPALMLVGWSGLFSAKATPSCLTSLIGFALIGLLFFNPGLALTGLAFLGAFYILRANLSPQNKGEK